MSHGFMKVNIRYIKAIHLIPHDIHDYGFRYDLENMQLFVFDTTDNIDTSNGGYRRKEKSHFPPSFCLTILLKNTIVSLIWLISIKQL